MKKRLNIEITKESAFGLICWFFLPHPPPGDFLYSIPPLLFELQLLSPFLVVDPPNRRSKYPFRFFRPWHLFFRFAGKVSECPPPQKKGGGVWGGFEGFLYSTALSIQCLTLSYLSLTERCGIVVWEVRGYHTLQSSAWVEIKIE